MLNILAKLGPVLTGMMRDEDGVLRKAPSDFRNLVHLPVVIGAVFVLLGLFGPGLPVERRDALWEVGFALLVGGPVVYHSRKRLTRGDAMQAPAPTPTEPVPAPETKPAPTDDADAAKQIENL